MNKVFVKYHSPNHTAESMSPIATVAAGSGSTKTFTIHAAHTHTTQTLSGKGCGAAANKQSTYSVTAPVKPTIPVTAVIAKTLMASGADSHQWSIGLKETGTVTVFYKIAAPCTASGGGLVFPVIGTYTGGMCRHAKT
jgi:hypothetical protein